MLLSVADEAQLTLTTSIKTSSSAALTIAWHYNSTTTENTTCESLSACTSAVSTTGLTTSTTYTYRPAETATASCQPTGDGDVVHYAGR